MNDTSSLRLVIKVRFHEGRYHGEGDWPPSPARLFQAMIAGVGLGGPLSKSDKESLRWFEALGAPTIAAPENKKGQEVTYFVPRNDLDSPGSRVETSFDVVSGTQTEWIKSRKGLRYPKKRQPTLFNEQSPFLYAWSVPQEDRERAKESCTLAESVYRLGHGIDMAWAQGSILRAKELETLLAEYPGQLYRPAEGSGRITLPCPQPGSLDGLVARYNANIERFRSDGGTRTLQQPSPISFAQVAYNSPSVIRLFEFREDTGQGRFVARPLERAATLVLNLREGVVEELKRALPGQEGGIEKAFDGGEEGARQGLEGSMRVKVIPIASIGHPYADRDIRRLLVEVPPSCPISSEDIFWAFSGATLDSRAVIQPVQEPQHQTMLAHYGVQQKRGRRVWRTQIPAALPKYARRRRIDPSRVQEEAKPGSERLDEEMRASKAVLTELRVHRSFPQVRSIRVQREPFETNGERVESFSDGSDFEKERIWHVEIEFEEEVHGPLVIGEGRFDGLGVMAPVRGGSD